MTRPRGHPGGRVSSLADLPRPPAGPGLVSGSGQHADPARLLDDVADALTACRAAGLDVRLAYDAVLTDAGYVLPDDTGWTARVRTSSPFPPPTAGDDD